MPDTKPFSQLAAPINADPARRARVELQKRAMRDATTIAELRAARSATIEQATERPEAPQQHVSHMEHGTDLYLSTLTDYIAALGGHLELTAVFPEGAVSLRVPDPPHEDMPPEVTAATETVTATGQR